MKLEILAWSVTQDDAGKQELSVSYAIGPAFEEDRPTGTFTFDPHVVHEDLEADSLSLGELTGLLEQRLTHVVRRRLS